MSNNNLAGFPSFGPRVDTKITYNPTQHNFDPAVQIPIGNPASGLYTFTITAEMLPETDPYGLSVKEYDVYVFARVKNVGASSAYVVSAYRMNGAAVNTGPVINSSVGADRYCSFCDLYNAAGGINIGDTIEIVTYSTTAGATVNIEWAAIVIVPVSPCLNMGAVKDLDIAISSASWFNGTANVPTTGRMQLSFHVGSLMAHTTAISSDIDLDVYYFKPTGPSLVPQDPATSIASTTQNQHIQPYYPTRIAYTPIL